MKTLYINGSTNILVDAENNTASKLDTCCQHINHIYLAKEPMHIVYGSGEYHEEADVEKGDIIIIFYHGRFKNQMIVVRSDRWVENIEAKIQEEQKEKERWAASKQEAIDEDNY